MRAFSACFSAILGIGICYIAACSSDSTTGGGPGAAGEAGSAPTAGSSGKGGGAGTSGAPGAAGAAGEPGAAGAAGASGVCAFDSKACTSCLSMHCATELGACSTAADCGGALSMLEPCACGGDMTAAMCETTFLADGGTKAQPLVDCFNTNCASVCSM